MKPSPMLEMAFVSSVFNRARSRMAVSAVKVPKTEAICSLAGRRSRQ